MLISRRVNQIVSLLIATREALTIKEISVRLKFSERTVYREMEDVRELIVSNGLELASLLNKGILLQGSTENIEKLKQKLRANASGDDYRVEERIELEVLKLLLEPSYIKLQGISADLNVSLSTIKNDQTQVREFLAKGNLLLVSKKGEGIKVQGNLYHRHILIMDILTKNLEISFLVGWLNNQIAEKSLFLKMLDSDLKNEFKDAYQIIGELATQQIVISDIESIEFSILLGFWLFSLKKAMTFDFDEKTNASNLNEETVFRLIESKLAKPLDKKSGEYYLKWIIQIYFGNEEATNNENSNELPKKINQFVENIEMNMGIKLLDNSELIIGLQKHMAKAINRIESGIAIRNPLESEIKKDYKNLYQLVKEGSEQVFGKGFFPTDEIGYLVLYFAVALDKMVKKSFRVLIVCSSGMGSAKMLSSRLEREVPELYVKKITSLIELGEMDLREYELILSTVPLFLKNNDYMQVSPLLNSKEIESIKQKIENHKYRSINVIQKERQRHSQMRQEGALETIKALRDCSTVADQLVNNFNLVNVAINTITSLKDTVATLLLENNLIEERDQVNLIKYWDQNYFKVPYQTYGILVSTVSSQQKIGLTIFDLHVESEKKEQFKIISIRHMNQENQKITALLSSLIISITTGDETARLLAKDNKKDLVLFIAEELRKILIEIF